MSGGGRDPMFGAGKGRSIVDSPTSRIVQKAIDVLEVARDLVLLDRLDEARALVREQVPWHLLRRQCPICYQDYYRDCVELAPRAIELHHLTALDFRVGSRVRAGRVFNHLPPIGEPERQPTLVVIRTEPWVGRFIVRELAVPHVERLTSRPVRRTVNP